MFLKIYKDNDPILRQVSSDVDIIDSDIKNLSIRMLHTMYRHNGIGLSAIQVGKPIRMFVASIDGETIFFINPKIVFASEDKFSTKEGCLSLPKHFSNIDRHKKIIVNYLDIEGNQNVKDFEGLWSICIQHEIDHLNGILMTDYN